MRGRQKIPIRYVIAKSRNLTQASLSGRPDNEAADSWFHLLASLMNRPKWPENMTGFVIRPFWQDNKFYSWFLIMGSYCNFVQELKNPNFYKGAMADMY